MSWPAVAWALGQRAPSSPAKFVLLALADATSVGEGLAWPSVAHLCERTQQDRKTVLGNLKKLEAQGLIARAGKAGRTGQVVMWRLAVDGPAQAVNDAESPENAPENTPEKGTIRVAAPVPVSPANDAGFAVQRSQKQDTETGRKLKETGRGRAAASSGSGRGSRLPADWAPSEADQAFCRKQRPDLDPQVVAATFRDHWASKTGKDATKQDWPATWRNWVRRERAPLAGAMGAPRRKPVLHADEPFTGSYA